ncbi:hypothetical protein CHUAL_002915 [Chamberlinius hualienensis]
MSNLFLKLLWISLLLTSVYGTTKPIKTFSKRPIVRRSEEIVFPVSNEEKCIEGLSCVSLDKCVAAFTDNRRQLPPICDWEGNNPLICCSLNPSTVETPFNEFPVEDCANHVAAIVVATKRSGKFIPSRREFNDEPKLVANAVVGGSNVMSVNVYPFMAAIYQTSGSEKLFLCGGSLISKNTVLTAAHCFLAKESTSKYLVQLGSIHTKVSGETPKLIDFEVLSVTVHAKFKFPELYNDIALVKIDGLAKYSDSIKPICLPDNEDDLKEPLNLFILGWGAKQAGESSSSILQEAEIEVVPASLCNTILSKIGALPVSFPKGINNQILCGGGSGTDACQGDSGGPAIALIDDVWLQFGIVCGGIGCGVPGNPGIYTRVSEYITWIHENVK